MDTRHHILIDATVESQAPFFAESPIFQRWLRVFNKIPEALEAILQAHEPNSIEIYVARDNIFDDGLRSNTSDQPRSLIATLDDLQTIRHVSVYCPNMNTNLEQQIPILVSNRRTIKNVISVVNLHLYMCNEGENYLNETITRYHVQGEMHLIPNLVQNLKELENYASQIYSERAKTLKPLIENYSDKSSQEST